MEGDKCFITAIIIALHHNEFAQPSRTAQYQKYVQDFDTSKIQFPMCAAQIQVFENTIPTFQCLHMSGLRRGQNVFTRQVTLVVRIPFTYFYIIIIGSLLPTFPVFIRR